LTLQNSVLQTPQNLVLQTLPQPLNDEFLIEFASIQDNDPQRRERARSPSGSQLPRNSTSATPIGQALLNTVSQTQQSTVSTTLRRELNDGFLRNINSNNSDNHVNRGCARSQGQGQGAPQLPRPNEVAQTTPNSVPQTMSNSVPQTMHPDCTPIAVLETTNSAPEANTLAPEPNTLAQEPNTLAPQAVTFIGVEFLNHINTSNNSDQLSMIRNDDNLDEAMGDVDP
jgi:hypothetical protein